ncbi:MAG: phage tail protein [Burkholderia gladioli]
MALSIPGSALTLLRGGFSNARSIADQFATDVLRSNTGAYQHALLGDVTFDLITYFEGTETRVGADFAEHKLIEGKPRLQWTGDKLDEVTWTLVFHAGFCEPEKELQKLRKLVAEHAAAPLHYSNGDYKGTFVPTDCSTTSRQVMRDGTLVWLEASLTLKEFVEPPKPVEQKPTQPATAAEKHATNGRRKPPRTVKAAAKARPKSAPVCRN